MDSLWQKDIGMSNGNIDILLKIGYDLIPFFQGVPMNNVQKMLEFMRDQRELGIEGQCELYGGWRKRYRIPNRSVDEFMARLIVRAEVNGRPKPDFIIMHRDFPVRSLAQPRPEGAHESIILWVQ